VLIGKMVINVSRISYCLHLQDQGVQAQTCQRRLGYYITTIWGGGGDRGEWASIGALAMRYTNELMALRI